ncbi:pentatricopeptide repeat-containing protein at2g13600 [Phtheirospermum japonicum]|uniref:Pentatricopeptide repeat-containing protein at2g13600 n=1 Tax=Phtheirospermum japonicum TaxID=374723 RepID=A0A830BV03_9LAMI|nr:pentatricopeptide repeat-containing protein at2g13600 [Phtheirospermum japonicum]
MFSQFHPVIHAPPPPSPSPPEPLLTLQSRLQFQKLNSRLALQEPKTNKHQSNQSSVSQTQTIILPFLTGKVNSTAYASILDYCTCPRLGKQVHAHLHKNGFHGREFVQTKLLQFYGKCGCVDDLVQVFDKMPERNLYTYAAAMNVLLDKGLSEEAFTCFKRLLFEDIVLEFFVFPVAFKICNGYGGVDLGKQLHGISTKIGVLSHNYVANALIDMYGKCRSLSDAEKVFDKMLERDCVSWNSMVTACAANGRVFEALDFLEKMSRENDLMPNFVSWSALIGGFAQNGYDEEAIGVLYKMRGAGFEPNARILASVLPACARLRNLRLGKEMYGYITRHGFMSSPYIVNGLIDLYRRCGAMESAYNVFSRFSVRDEVSFNTMIAGYCENKEILKAKELFDTMGYEKKSKDLISWNSMISGYADNFMFDEALRLFIDLMSNEEIEPDSFTLGSVLSACAEIGFLKLGKSIHSYCIVKGLHSNPFIGGALVDMYCQCRDLEAAQKVFCQVNEKDIVIWNTFISGYASCNKIESIQSILKWMKDDGFEPNIYTWNGIIAGYVENGHNESALKLFSDLQVSNLKPDIYTVGIVIPACSRLATIERGKQVHAYAVRCGFDSDLYIRAALIDMYAKCGIMKYAKLVHNRTKNHNLVTQNAMLNAYAMHGHGGDGIDFFRKMLVDGFKPDNVTFLAVLSSCVHAGSVETGQEFFDLMGLYGVTPTLKHYTCMVDLLSRAGKVKHAYNMVEKMPMKTDSVLWSALVSSCIIHGDVDLGEIAANKLIELEPDNSGNYVMLANLYASTGKWHELRKIRQQMKDEQLHKNPGCSWIEDRDETHVFMAWDKSHKRAKEIYDTLDILTAQMQLEKVQLL